MFQKAGPLAAHEKWFVGNKVVLNQYCCPGLFFSSLLSTNIMLSNLATRGRTALVTVLRSVSKEQDISVDVFFKLFDAQFKQFYCTVQKYGEWENCYILENVHLYAMNKFLRVGPTDFHPECDDIWCYRTV